MNTDERTDKDECAAKCITDASCDSLEGTDQQGGLDFVAYLGKC